MGFLGILEDTKLAHVPATVILDDVHNTGNANSSTSSLKHGTGRHSHVVLVPQPSEDPNDPLNWPTHKKTVIMMLASLGGCIFASTFGPLLNAGLFVVAQELDRTLTDITVTSGYTLLVAGSSGAFVSAFSQKWGKRPVLLVSALFGFIGSIMGSTVTSYHTLLAARIVQGFATAAYESLIISMIGDLYFVHQRGVYVALTSLILGGVSNFSSVICGAITKNLGWKYLFHFCTMASGLHLILSFFFWPETQYRRDHRYDIDELIDDNLDELVGVEKRHQAELEDIEKTATTVSSSSAFHIPPKKTFMQELAIFSGIYSSQNLLKLIAAPFLVNTNLAVLFVVVITGSLTALYVAMSFVIAQIFSAPPYLLTPFGVGNLFIGPFIGGLVAVVFVAATYDGFIKWCSRKNNGVYEPEYRLLLNWFGIVAAAGLVGFGVLCQNSASYYATATMHAIVLFGIVASSTALNSYALDAFRDMSNEIFVAGIIYKNFLFYGFSYFVNNWTATAGPKVVFGTFGGVAAALVLTTPIFFHWGKRYRSHWARHNILKKLSIETHASL
ncbi:hypothetical protein LTR64_008398 [Lithohypha guttulata]|uniref:uncharacterized protein n=1 Tax=Lithohypha guttulata TaxID=1690604 RepID=UPI002DE14577|nr:hypothetical protein LTR51_008557 [Lithohypha guttulata]